MKTKLLPLTFAFLLALVLNATAATRYVDLNSPSPTPPYTSWATAANVIQDAVDAAGSGDTVLVTNGVYGTGGKVVFGAMTNRVAVNKALTLASVNGPEFTFIRGQRVSGTTNGNGAVRCVYLTNGAFLSGFTLTNGATRTSGDLIVDGRGGALWCGSTNAWASNCVMVANSSHDRGGAVYQGTLISCTLLQNFTSGHGGGSAFGAMINCNLKNNSAATYGGGSFFGVLDSCTLSNNSAQLGGGAHLDTLNNCILSGNIGRGDAGGAYGGVLNNCTLVGNSALNYGGGSSDGILSNCVISANSAKYSGGSYGGTLIDCLIKGNSATNQGGGASYATLYNCTVTNNWSGDGGGGTAYGVLNNCVVISNSAALFGGGAAAGTLTNCTLAGNSATFGGGAYSSTLSGCTVTGNRATSSGGGVSSGTASNCVISGNFSANSGGGSTGGELVDCVLSGNSANTGGGASGGKLKNCTLSGNTASGNGGGGSDFVAMENCRLVNNSAKRGGGSYYGSLKNCVVARNSASEFGGGSYFGSLTNCTLTGNTAGVSGGGAYQGTFYNCIVYFNSAATSGDNYFGSTFNHSCTTPLPPVGTGNISGNPLLASASYLSPLSPCIGAGSASYATGKDIDGQSWASPPSLGCDEYLGGLAVGPLSLAAIASHLYVGVGFAVDFSADINGQAVVSAWDFGDGTVVSNQPYTSHAWTTPGDYSVVLRAYNNSWPAGLSTIVTVRVAEQWVHHVSAGGANPIPPYDSWATAATNIQDAIDAAAPGAVILVTNGLYASGGKALFGTMTNRVAVDKPLTVRSVNGPGVTIIKGYQVPGTTNGPGAIRGAWLTEGSVLSGFTLTSGATRASGDLFKERSGGGAWCASTNVWITNCVLVANAAHGNGAGVYQGTLAGCSLLTNKAANLGGGSYEAILNACTVAGNVADTGGGVSLGVLNNCLVSGNTATSIGGGCFQATLNHSTLTGNSASYGGGDFQSTLKNCLLSTNSATWGGGSQNGTLSGCTLVGNSASTYGGGSYYGTLQNCTLTGNSCGDSGGGAYAGVLTNCTLTGNAAERGGGTCYAIANNCIIYFNAAATAGSNHYGGTLNYSCTLPLPEGEGNIDQNPLLASASHLSAASPCIGSGSTNYATGTDIDDEPWASPPSMGCDEYWSGSATGALSVAIQAGYTNVAVGFVVNFAGGISGHASANAWDFGDGTVVSNYLHASHSWATPGNYAVVLRAYNETWPSGVSATTIVHVVNTIHHVAADGINPIPPYDSWATAATNIQDALEAAIAPGTTILVTNGLYASGGKAVYGLMTNRVVVNKFQTLRSVNGPQFTTIQGYRVPSTTNGPGAVRCAYVADGATLIGFTLAQGATCAVGDPVQERSGGGLWCESMNVVVSNCVITGNAAHYCGGGAYGGTLTHCILRDNSANNDGGGCHDGVMNNCTLAGNFSGNRGGGAYRGTLNDSTITGNTASGNGGGMYEAALKNCIVYFNTSTSGFGNNYIGGYGDSTGQLDYCCTTPLPPYGIGNFTNAPGFLDTNGWSNLRLATNSPCINSGNHSYSAAGVDLDGNPRVAGGTVDIGAYEFQSPASLLSYAWAQQNGLAVDGSADFTDADGDGMNNYGEWRSDTIPTNSLSVLRMVNAASSPSGAEVTWESVATRSYWLERATNLGVASPFQTVATNIAGVAGVKTYSDTTATNGGPYFYRVGVQ